MPFLLTYSIKKKFFKDIYKYCTTIIVMNNTENEWLLLCSRSTRILSSIACWSNAINTSSLFLFNIILAKRNFLSIWVRNYKNKIIITKKWKQLNEQVN